MGRSLRKPRNRSSIKSLMATLLPLALCLLISLLSPASTKPSPKHLLIETNESKNNDDVIGITNKIRQAVSPEEKAKNDYSGDEVIVYPCPQRRIWTVVIAEC